MRKVLLLLCKGVEIYEVAAFYDVFGWAGVYGSEAVRCVTVGLSSEVQATFGLKIIPDTLLSSVQADDFDALAIPGGFEAYGYYEEAYSEPVLNLIRDFHALHKPMASICVGALPIGKSGVLRGQRATTYPLRDGLRRKQLAEFGVQVIDASIVREGNITTSTSPATAMDVAFGLLADLTGQENADCVRHKMGFVNNEGERFTNQR